MLRKRSKVAFTESELTNMVGLFRRMPRVTVREVEAALDMTAFRARMILDVLGEIVDHVRYRGSRAPVFVARPNSHALIATRLEEQAYRQRRRFDRSLDGPKPPPIAKDAPTYPSGFAHHFETDWLGRVTYVGPERRQDERWQLEDVA